MADAKDDAVENLDATIEQLMTEEVEIDLTEEEPVDELAALRAERDEFKDRFMRLWRTPRIRASVVSVIVVKPRIMADQNWRAICCRSTTT